MQRLEQGQKFAREMHEGQGTAFEFGGEIFQIWCGGSQGHRWVFENDDLQFHIRTEKPMFNISVRYKSAGLWEHGVDALRARVKRLLLSEIRPLQEDWHTLTRIDYAFDFYSPDFSQEMLSTMVAENMVLTSGVKAEMVFTSKRIETLTIGMNRKGLQVQVYDKGKEILEASGKTWMFEVYEQEGYYPPDNMKAQHIWRVEVRFGKEFLKDRNIRTFEDFRPKIKELLAEAIMRRRIVDQGDSIDSHKERWGLHPLWAAVYDASGRADDYVPVGRQITMKRDHYIEMMRKQMAGVGRSLSVAQTGHYSEETARDDARQSVYMAMSDYDHDRKVLKAVERQKYLEEAQ